MMCKWPYVRCPTGVKKRDVYLSEQGRLAATPFGCGRCLPCKINKAREITVRIVLESMTHDESVFTTLTYDNDNVPAGGNLDKDEYCKFLKRLRYHLDKPFRYLGVGEYGDNSERPHYHLCLFGIGPNCKRIIERAWERGFVHVGEINQKSARYIAGYTIKKLTRPGDPRLKGRSPEFRTSSKKGGGIGLPAIMRIAERMKRYRVEEVIREVRHAGKKYPLGRYLTEKLAAEMGTKHRLEQETWKHQIDYLDKHLDSEMYYDSMVEEKAVERYAQERKNRLFKGARKL